MAQQPAVDWAINGSGFYEIALDANNNIYSIFIHSDSLIGLRKQNTNGELVWSEQDTLSHYSYACIKTDNKGNTCIAGVHRIFSHKEEYFDPPYFYTISFYNTCIFLTKYDSLGNNVWKVNSQYNLDTLGDIARIKSIDIDQENNIIIYGELKGLLTLDSLSITDDISFNTTSLFIAKFSENGDIIWLKQMQGGSNTAKYCEIDNYNNIYLSGEFYGVLNLSDTIVFTGGYGFFICKMDTYGNIIWVKHGGSDMNTSHFHSMSITQNSEIYFTGELDGTGHFDNHFLETDGYIQDFVCKLDSSGNVLWDTIVDAFNNGTIVKTYDSSILLSISFKDTLIVNNNIYISNGGLDYCLVELADNGYVNWVKHIGGVGHDGVKSIEIDSCNNVLLLAFFEDSLQLDNFNLIADGYHYFIAKFLRDSLFFNNINEIKKNINVKIYPNPAHQIINIEGQFNENTLIEIYDVSGKLIHYKDIKSSNSVCITKLHLTKCNKGYYFIVIRNSKYVKAEKVLFY